MAYSFSSSADGFLSLREIYLPLDCLAAPGGLMISNAKGASCAAAAAASETATNGVIIVIFIAPRRTFVFRDAASHRLRERELECSAVQGCRPQSPISLSLSLSLSPSLSLASRDPSSDDEKCIKSFRTIRTRWTAVKAEAEAGIGGSVFVRCQRRVSHSRATARNTP